MKKCPFCAEEIQDAAVKCRFCGSMLNGAPGVSAGPAAAPNAAPVVGGVVPAGVRDVPAVPIFEGTPSWKAQFWSNAAALGTVVLGLGASVGLHLASSDIQWNTSLIVGGSLVVLGLFWWAYLTLGRRAIKYRVSTRTIDLESGLLSKRIDTLQLWKVRDLEFNQTFIDRLLNVARIRIFTHDVTTPELNLWGVPESREIFDRLKNAIEIARQSRNVVGVVE